MNTCDHIELSTDDPKRAQAFYSKVFGWKFETMPTPGGGGQYLMFRTGETGGGGIAGKQMPGQPTAWMPYITVDSVKATVKAAKANGGSALVEYMPVGDMGALGIFTDSTGGAIGVWESARKAPAPAPAKKAAPKKAAAKKAPAKKAAPKKAAKKAPAKKAAKR